MGCQYVWPQPGRQRGSRALFRDSLIFASPSTLARQIQDASGARKRCSGRCLFVIFDWQVSRPGLPGLVPCRKPAPCGISVSLARENRDVGGARQRYSGIPLFAPARPRQPGSTRTPAGPGSTVQVCGPSSLSTRKSLVPFLPGLVPCRALAPYRLLASPGMSVGQLAMRRGALSPGLSGPLMVDHLGLPPSYTSAPQGGEAVTQPGDHHWLLTQGPVPSLSPPFLTPSPGAAVSEPTEPGGGCAWGGRGTPGRVCPTLLPASLGSPQAGAALWRVGLGALPARQSTPPCRATSGLGGCSYSTAPAANRTRAPVWARSGPSTSRACVRPTSAGPAVSRQGQT